MYDLPRAIVPPIDDYVQFIVRIVLPQKAAKTLRKLRVGAAQGKQDRRSRKRLLVVRRLPPAQQRREASGEAPGAMP